jgi:organic hydroperoxide reductase OsmC/OhrA
MSLDKVLYTAKAPHHRRPETTVAPAPMMGRLDVAPFLPRARRGAGTNPEQLFAAGWSASLSLGDQARGREEACRPARPTPVIDAEVDLRLTDSAFSLAARLNIQPAGLERSVAQAARGRPRTETCPTPRRYGGNIDVAPQPGLVRQGSIPMGQDGEW